MVFVFFLFFNSRMPAKTWARKHTITKTMLSKENYCLTTIIYNQPNYRTFTIGVPCTLLGSCELAKDYSAKQLYEILPLYPRQFGTTVFIRWSYLFIYLFIYLLFLITIFFYASRQTHAQGLKIKQGLGYNQLFFQGPLPPTPGAETGLPPLRM